MPARNPLRANSHLLTLHGEPWWVCTHCQCRECEDRSFFCKLRQWNDRRRIETAREYGVAWLVPIMARAEEEAT